MIAINRQPGPYELISIGIVSALETTFERWLTFIAAWREARLF